MVGVVNDLLTFLGVSTLKLVLDIIAWVLGPFLFFYDRFKAGKPKQYKSILITGGNAGLGEYLALAFAGPGVRLVLTARDIGKLQSVKEKCEKKGSEVVVESVDVRNKEAMEGIIERNDSQNPFDLVIANAGVTSETLGLKNIEDHIKPMCDINIEGVINTIFPLIPRFRKRRNGQIAIMSSVAGFLPMSSSPTYSSTKVFVRYFGESLRPLLAHDNIGVSVICPGYVRSAITEAHLKKKVNLPFMLEPQDAAVIMKDGLERNVGVISYPFPLVMFTTFVGGLVSEVRALVISAMAPRSGARFFFKDP
jgi:short-subunit dehydrogenase